MNIRFNKINKACYVHIRLGMITVYDDEELTTPIVSLPPVSAR